MFIYLGPNNGIKMYLNGTEVIQFSPFLELIIDHDS